MLVTIELFFKWLETILLINNNNKGTMYTFLDRVFNRVGIPTKIPINQNTKTLWGILRIV
jgi:hypothetical protein